MKAMTYTEIEATYIDSLIADSRVAIEQKVDGTRCLIHFEERDGVASVRFLGRGGGPLKHTAAMQHFEGIKWALLDHLPSNVEAFIDGEVMIDTGAFVAFDLPMFVVDGRPRVTTDKPYWERLQMLRTLFHNAPRPLTLVRSETDRTAKARLWAEIKESGGEGVMAKSLDAPYEPGKRVVHSRKIKFVKTADVIVTGTTRGRNEAGRETGSYSFAVYNDRGALINLGAASAIGKPFCPIGSVIEVAYLYRGEGGGLVQPRIIRIREDKRPADCTLDQFPIYSKAVL